MGGACSGGGKRWEIVSNAAELGRGGGASQSFDFLLFLFYSCSRRHVVDDISCRHHDIDIPSSTLLIVDPDQTLPSSTDGRSVLIADQD